VNVSLRRLASTLVLALVATLTPHSPASAAESAPDVVITGRVVDMNGAPVKRAKVVVSDGEYFLIQFVDVIGCIFTLGLIDDACPIHSVTVKTDASGRYRAVLPTGSLVAEARIREISVSRAATAFSGSFRSTRGRLADIVVWTSMASFRRTAGRVQVRQTLPPGAVPAETLTVDAPDVDIFDDSWWLELGNAWLLKFNDTGLTNVDARVFETARVELEGSTHGTWSNRPATWTAPSAEPPDFGRPGSRGVACSMYDELNRLVAIPDCPFTDGRVASAFGVRNAVDFVSDSDICERGTACTANTIVFDLGELRAPDAIVLRNCSACRVELSADGNTWSDWRGERRGNGQFVVVTGNWQPTRHVRVRGDAFTLWQLTEVSIWSTSLIESLPPDLDDLGQGPLPLTRLLGLTPPAPSPSPLAPVPVTITTGSLGSMMESCPGCSPLSPHSP
jgi:hypothetical protein